MKHHTLGGSKKAERREWCVATTTMMEVRPRAVRTESERDIFRTCQGRRFRKNCERGVDKGEGKGIYLRRFEGSRLTCVYKGPKF